MSPTEFELLVIFFYTGDVQFNSVAELCCGLYAASLYKMENLQKVCSARLQEKLKEDCGNALLILQLHERFNLRDDNADLFDQVELLIKKDYGQILSSGVIEKLERETMEQLLKMDSICSVAEIELFRALSRWTNARCNKSGSKNLQKMAGDLIYHIRYNLIPLDLLGKEVTSSRLLPGTLIAQVFEQHYNKNLKVPFCTESRVKKEDEGASNQVIYLKYMTR